MVSGRPRSIRGSSRARSSGDSQSRRCEGLFEDVSSGRPHQEPPTTQLSKDSGKVATPFIGAGSYERNRADSIIGDKQSSFFFLLSLCALFVRSAKDIV